MDDFEKDFPEFDWKNIPAYKHPGGKDCPCPKHEYIREQINVTKTLSIESKDNRRHELNFVQIIIPSILTRLYHQCRSNTD